MHMESTALKVRDAIQALRLDLLTMRMKTQIDQAFYKKLLIFFEKVQGAFIAKQSDFIIELGL